MTTHLPSVVEAHAAAALGMEEAVQEVEAGGGSLVVTAAAAAQTEAVTSRAAETTAQAVANL